MSQVITTQPKANIDENEGEISTQNEQEINEAEKKKMKEKKSCLYKWCGILRPNDDPVDVGDDGGTGSDNCCCGTGVGNTGGDNTRNGDSEDYGCDCWGGCDSGDGGCNTCDGGCDGGDGGGDSGDYGYDNGDGGYDIGDTGGDSGGGGID